MEHAHQLVLIGSLLLVAGIVAGMLSTRVGAPLLLVFLALGMGAGPDGIGLHITSVSYAYLVGSAALAVILFDGGLHTRRRTFQLAIAPASLLATVGVVVTAAVTGAAATFFLHISWIEGMLIGAIVSSTDAAAIFLLLYQGGREVSQRVSATLETEAGFNDPIAVFMTVTLVTLASRTHHGALAPLDLAPLGLAMDFLREAGFGAIFGIVGGAVIVQLINRMTLLGGLHPILAMSCALALFGGTQVAGGSGFLAVYLAGLITGNSRLRASQSVLRFHEGIAWLAQLVLFIMLGLMVVPHRLIGEIPLALPVALVLIFVARPLAVWLCLTPFRFNIRERLFIGWVGLRGAVPIFLAVIPQLSHLPHSEIYFEVAFSVVLTSLLLQGWTVAPAARWLKLALPGDGRARRLDLDIAEAGSREISAYRIPAGAPATQRAFDQLPLPRRTRIIAVLREGVVMNRKQLERLQPNDVVLALTPPETMETLDRLFSERQNAELSETVFGDFVLDPTVPMATVVDLYGLPATLSDRAKSVGTFLHQRLDRSAVVGDRIHVGLVDLIVRRLDENDEIAEIGVVLEPEPDPFEALSIRRRLRRGASVLRRDYRRFRARLKRKRKRQV